MLYIRSPTHSACMQARHAFEPRPHLFVDHTVVIMIWRAQNVDSTRAYSSSTTPDKYVFSPVRVPYGAAVLKLVLGHVR